MSNNYIQIYSFEMFQRVKFSTWQPQYTNCGTWHNEYFAARQKNIFLTGMKFLLSSQFVISCTVKKLHIGDLYVTELCRGKAILFLLRNNARFEGMDICKGGIKHFLVDIKSDLTLN